MYQTICFGHVQFIRMHKHKLVNNLYPFSVSHHISYISNASRSKKTAITNFNLLQTNRSFYIIRCMNVTLDDTVCNNLAYLSAISPQDCIYVTFFGEKDQVFLHRKQFIHLVHMEPLITYEKCL